MSGPGIDTVLAAARRRLERLDPVALRSAIDDGALVVDIRPDADRAAEGTIPGAVAIHRNVLEWRLDPAGDARASGIEHRWDRLIVVVCNEGYTSSLAAAALQDIGLGRATDLIGGHRAWIAAGLPVEP